MNVAANMPRACFRSQSCRAQRMRRGPKVAVPNWTSSSTIVTTKPVKASMPVAIDDRTSRTLSGSAPVLARDPGRTAPCDRSAGR